jgi:hypothetical protein
MTMLEEMSCRLDPNNRLFHHEEYCLGLEWQGTQNVLILNAVGTIYRLVVLETLEQWAEEHLYSMG